MRERFVGGISVERDGEQIEVIVLDKNDELRFCAAMASARGSER